MVKFGTLKSKIEKKLLESYTKNTFKNEISNFKNYVLSNKKISKLFYLYEELSSKKNLSETESKDFISESLSIIRKIKLNDNEIKQIQKWTSGIKTKNDYKKIDDLVSENLDVAKIVTLKKVLSENLMKKDEILKSETNLPIKSMVNIANQTLSNHLKTLSESERKEFDSINSLTDEQLVTEFKKNTSEINSKLSGYLSESKDESQKQKINETIESIKTKQINKLELFKLINLNKSL